MWGNCKHLHCRVFTHETVVSRNTSHIHQDNNHGNRNQQEVALEYSWKNNEKGNCPKFCL